MTKPTILFMGTPEFATPSLKALIRAGYPVVGVVTQPDRPKGRGKHLAPPAAKVKAEELGIEVFQPERVRDGSFLDTLRRLRPDLVAVAAFGQILPKAVLEAPPLGCLNVHPSLLPKYRGAAPINWTLIRGERVTGVTIMFMDEGMDTGDILLQEETPIGAEENAGELHDRLAVSGAGLLVRTIDGLLAGTVRRRPQESNLATLAPRLTKEHGLIRWEQPAAEIVNLVRGLAPAPCAYTWLDGKQVKVFSASAQEQPATEPPGKIRALVDAGLAVSAGDGVVLLKDIQMESKKRMPVREFFRGYRPRSSFLTDSPTARTAE
ncbi:MAG: methionyl-tRNA formyltransferase [Syntrophaceae bacterium]|nr:methionyl-tRNA formyltransferase [Syntrophaceae bacterium]